MSLDDLFPNGPATNLPDAGPPLKRGPGRPRKNPLPPLKLVPEPTPTAPASVDRQFMTDIVEPTRGEPNGPASADPPLVTDAEFADMLARARFGDYGSMARALCVVHKDRSPSTSLHEPASRSGAARITAAFQANPAGRNRCDVAHTAGAEWAKIVSFEHGKLVIPDRIEYGRGTYGVPWLDLIETVTRQWKDHLTGLGIGTTDGMALLLTDGVFGDHADVTAALPGWKERMTRLGMTVVVGMFGDFNEPACQALGHVPAVPLDQVPMQVLFDVLGASMTTSLGRPGSLRGMLAGAIQNLLAGK